MKKKFYTLAVMAGLLFCFSGCTALDVVKDILSVNTADTSKDDGPKVTITKPTAAPRPTESVTPTLTPTPTPSEEPKEIIYCSSPVNVRAAADSNSQVLDSLTAGQEVEKIGEDGGWIQIRYEGVEGWVYHKYMTDQKI